MCEAKPHSFLDPVRAESGCAFQAAPDAHGMTTYDFLKEMEPFSLTRKCHENPAF
jgi:hypothetical protein